MLNPELPGRDMDLEPDPVTRYTTFPDGHAGYVQDLPDQEQPKAVTGAKPALEDSLFVRLRDPDPVIFIRDREATGLFFVSDPDRGDMTPVMY